MRICPNCNQEVDDLNFVCPHCHQRMPSKQKPITGHASMGNLDEYNARMIVSQEDKSMIRDKNHMSDSEDGMDFDCDQPYSFVKRENGDRN